MAGIERKAALAKVVPIFTHPRWITTFTNAVTIGFSLLQWNLTKSLE